MTAVSVDFAQNPVGKRDKRKDRVRLICVRNLISVSEIAEVLGISRQRVYYFKRNDETFPEPVHGEGVWNWPDVVGWLVRRRGWEQHKDDNGITWTTRPETKGKRIVTAWSDWDGEDVGTFSRSLWDVGVVRPAGSATRR